MEPRSLQDVFRILDEMQSEAVVERFAVVGAVATLFYAETIRTYDLDVAVLLPAEPSLAGTILTLRPVYDWLRERGFRPEREHVRIHDVPVQFLSGDPPLWRDAVESAREFDYEGVKVPVAPPEHLVLMTLEAPSPRRRERGALLVESGAVDRLQLGRLAARFGFSLPEAWRA